MEYYQEMVETEDGIPARIYYGGTGRDKLYYPLHWHRNLEFDLVMEGRIRGRVNGKEQSAGPGEIFFCEQRRAARDGRERGTDPTLCDAAAR